MPDVLERVARVGMDSDPSSAAEMRQKMGTDLETWTR